MRFFVALEIPDQSRDEIEKLQHQLKKFIPSLRLTDPQKLHLTIAFIGEQNASLQTKLMALVRSAAEKIPPFEITPAYLDGFPNIHYPHTFWIGVKGDIDQLMILRERVKDSLTNLGIPVDERRFIPHIAIAKVNDSFSLSNQAESDLQQMMQQRFKPIKVSSIKLFESIPNHGFHQHNTLAETKLI